MHLLVVERDRGFREELHNFLLSAGFSCIDLADDPPSSFALAEKRIDAVILGAASAAASRPLIERLRRSLPDARLIVLIETDEPAATDNGRAELWRSVAERVYFLIRNSYALQLPAILVEDCTE